MDPVVIDSQTGMEREVDSEDEVSEGGADPYLNYVNKLWKLKLSEDSDGVSLMARVIKMLGLPPKFDADVGAGAHDVARRKRWSRISSDRLNLHCDLQ